MAQSHIPDLFSFFKNRSKTKVGAMRTNVERIPGYYPLFALTRKNQALDSPYSHHTPLEKITVVNVLKMILRSSMIDLFLM